MITDRWQTPRSSKAEFGDRSKRRHVAILPSFENKPDELSRREVVCRLLVRFSASWLLFDRGAAGLFLS